MDPIGFSLENFDAVGAWRTREGGTDIDPSDVLYDGTAVTGPADLRRYIERSERLFVRNFARNLLMFGLGRVLQPSDMSTVRGITRLAAHKENQFSSFVMGIVPRPPFTMRQSDDEVVAEQAAP